MRIPQRQPQRRLWKRCKEQFPKCLSLLLVFALTAPLYSYAFVYAAEDSESTGLCKHHPEHTADCGYTEAAVMKSRQKAYLADIYTTSLAVMWRLQRKRPAIWDARTRTATA